MSERFSAIVPTYRRPDVLVNCVAALHKQTLPPLEVLVCYRVSDTETARALEGLPEASCHLLRRIVLGPDDNFATAINAGIRECHGDFIALTDDDAEPHSDWLLRMAQHFSDVRVAGVGGRDLQVGSDHQEPVVGKIQWYGRRISNHQWGSGDPRDVEVLKGVNCCFRSKLLKELGVDRRLRGAGNVMHTELAMCLPMVRAGWRLVYDPAVLVTHHVAARKDGDNNQRGTFTPLPLRAITHNETLMLLEHLPAMGRLAFLGWSELVGTRFSPGLVALGRTLLSSAKPTEAVHRYWVTRVGRLDGLKSWLSSSGAACQVAAYSPGAE